MKKRKAKHLLTSSLLVFSSLSLSANTLFIKLNYGTVGENAYVKDNKFTNGSFDFLKNFSSERDLNIYFDKNTKYNFTFNSSSENDEYQTGISSMAHFYQTIERNLSNGVFDFAGLPRIETFIDNYNLYSGDKKVYEIMYRHGWFNKNIPHISKSEIDSRTNSSSDDISNLPYLYNTKNTFIPIKTTFDFLSLNREELYSKWAKDYQRHSESIWDYGISDHLFDTRYNWWEIYIYSFCGGGLLYGGDYYDDDFDGLVDFFINSKVQKANGDYVFTMKFINETGYFKAKNQDKRTVDILNDGKLMKTFCSDLKKWNKRDIDYSLIKSKLGIKLKKLPAYYPILIMTNKKDGKGGLENLNGKYLSIREFIDYFYDMPNEIVESEFNKIVKSVDISKWKFYDTYYNDNKNYLKWTKDKKSGKYKTTMSDKTSNYTTMIKSIKRKIKNNVMIFSKEKDYILTVLSMFEEIFEKQTTIFPDIKYDNKGIRGTNSFTCTGYDYDNLKKTSEVYRESNYKLENETFSNTISSILSKYNKQIGFKSAVFDLKEDQIFRLRVQGLEENVELKNSRFNTIPKIRMRFTSHFIDLKNFGVDITRQEILKIWSIGKNGDSNLRTTLNIKKDLVLPLYVKKTDEEKEKAVDFSKKRKEVDEENLKNNKETIESQKDIFELEYSKDDNRAYLVEWINEKYNKTYKDRLTKDEISQLIEYNGDISKVKDEEGHSPNYPDDTYWEDISFWMEATAVYYNLERLKLKGEAEAKKSTLIEEKKELDNEFNNLLENEPEKMIEKEEQECLKKNEDGDCINMVTKTTSMENPDWNKWNSDVEDYKLLLKQKQKDISSEDQTIADNTGNLSYEEVSTIFKSKLYQAYMVNKTTIELKKETVAGSDYPKIIAIVKSAEPGAITPASGKDTKSLFDKKSNEHLKELGWFFYNSDKGISDLTTEKVSQDYIDTLKSIFIETTDPSLNK